MAAEAADVSAQTQSSVTDRIKTALFSSQSDGSLKSESSQEGSETEQTESRKAPSGGVAPAQKAAPEKAVPNEKVEGDDAETESEDQPDTEADAETSDDAQSEEVQFSSLTELAEAIGWDLEKILDLSASTKIDGKEGTARLRDLVKSYQLDGHINQKLATLDTDRKALMAKQAEHERAAAERLLKLDAGVKTLERQLMGEFASVDWQKLQAENPLEFNARYVAYQTRYAAMNDIANQLAQEQRTFQEGQAAKAKEYLEEQFKLLQAKVPEWSDRTRRDKDKADISEYLKGLGISREEFEAIGDHRQLLVVRDAWKWHQLQKSKPSTLNKVKAAPKLLKPGTTQSRAAKDALADQNDRSKLKQTGRVRDAVPALKRRLFGAR